MRPTLLALTGLLLLLAPAAQAVEYGFGTATGSSDYDFTPMAETTKVALCFIDYNGDATVGAGEPILLLFKVATGGVCPATLSNNAILLNYVDGRLPGIEINQMDRWGGKSIVSLAATNFVRYFEDGTDPSKLDSKDSVYLDLKNTATPRVDVGDLRISAVGTFVGGTLVAAGDLDANRPLSEIKGTARTVSSANIIYKAGSAYYINADAGAIGGTVDGTCVATACPVSGDFGVESGDIRLNPKAVNPLSDTAIILPDHIEIVQASVAPGQAFQVKVLAKNTGKAPGAGLIETRIGDDLVDARGTPTIPANGEATLVLTLVAPRTPGQYVVKSGAYADFLKVEGAVSGGDLASLEGQVQDMQAQVAAMESQDDGNAAAASLGAPGLGPTALVLALGLLAVALRRSA